MAGDKNHYERAFSGLLAENGIQALAVDETRRPVLSGIELKNFDFLVNGIEAVWALDLKGRRDRPWITRTDLFSMMGWKTLLGEAVQPGFAFAFFHSHEDAPARLTQLDATRIETAAGVYHFCVLPVAEAQRIARPRSAKWGTFGFDWNPFARSVRPLDAILPLPLVV